MRLVLLAASLSLIIACGSKEATPSGPPPTPPVAAAPPAAAPPAAAPPAAAPTAAAVGHLPLATGALAIEIGGARKEFALRATGEVIADGAVIGRLSGDGVATNGTGKRLATIAADGTVTIVGEAETFTVAPDGSATRAGTPLVTIGADGVLGGAAVAEAAAGSKIAISGDVAARQALIFAWLVL
mgnify:FL=1